jgi:hypothetical protein
MAVKIVGLIVIVLGWLIAVSSTQVSGTGLQLFVAVLGLVVSAVGVIGILNPAHLEHAIWKS